MGAVVAIVVIVVATCAARVVCVVVVVVVEVVSNSAKHVKMGSIVRPFFALVSKYNIGLRFPCESHHFFAISEGTLNMSINVTNKTIKIINIS